MCASPTRVTAFQRPPDGSVKHEDRFAASMKRKLHLYMVAVKSNTPYIDIIAQSLPFLRVRCPRASACLRSVENLRVNRRLGCCGESTVEACRCAVNYRNLVHGCAECGKGGKGVRKRRRRRLSLLLCFACVREYDFVTNRFQFTFRLTWSIHSCSSPPDGPRSNWN